MFKKNGGTYGWTDGWTDGPTDTPSYREARTHLKMEHFPICDAAVLRPLQGRCPKRSIFIGFPESVTDGLTN